MTPVSLQVYATFTEGSWRCFRAPDGKTKVFIGCRHLNPKSAIAHTANLDPFTEPLRVSDGASTPVPCPPAGLGLLDVPSEPRLGDPPRP